MLIDWHIGAIGQYPFSGILPGTLTNWLGAELIFIYGTPKIGDGLAYTPGLKEGVVYIAGVKAGRTFRVGIHNGEVTP